MIGNLELQLAILFYFIFFEFCANFCFFACVAIEMQSHDLAYVLNLKSEQSVESINQIKTKFINLHK